MRISRFTRKKNFSTNNSVFLLFVKIYMQSTALFNAQWKGNRVLMICLEIEAQHHLPLIQNLCHQWGLFVFRELCWSASEMPNERGPMFSFIILCVTSLSSFGQNPIARHDGQQPYTCCYRLLIKDIKTVTFGRISQSSETVSELD